MGKRHVTTSSINRALISGESIHSCLRGILARCVKAGVRLDFPGEGGERRFRSWLVSDLVTGLFGWPGEKVVVGERFDIILQDADGFPVATIETKTPYRKASKKERLDFEKRLSGYGTLRTAFFTNGSEWERLDIFAPTGVLDIRERFELHLDNARSEETEAFFTPLFASRHFVTTPRSTRHGVGRENPHILEALAADLDQSIKELTFFFRSLFIGLRDGKAGEQVRGVTLALFELWCQKALVTSPKQAAEHLVERFKKEDLKHQEIARNLVELGLAEPSITNVAEHLASMRRTEQQDFTAVIDGLWPSYHQAIENLCAQTAHVLLGRALLYRVGEDQNVFPRTLSGVQMEQALSMLPGTLLDTPPPAADLLNRVRAAMEDFLPTVYTLGEFDWWLVTPYSRSALAARERVWLRQMDIEFDRAGQRLLLILNGYFFGSVDVDVWRNVYQHYLPPEERQRIGGFYTHDNLVHMVLDLMDYSPNANGLCKLSFIDPACGSGAFVAGALGRLLAHFQLNLPCHAQLHKRNLPIWKQAEQILAIIGENLHGVDLHPFAAFLTTLNVLFLVLPLYVKVRQNNRDFTLNLQVFSADSLEKREAQLLKPGLFESLNSRVRLTTDSYSRYQEMLEKQFDRLFGNPPWGGVLKGRLAPVYDTVKKHRFSHEFPSAAQGKYDIYGLFMERALQILKRGGRFGLLTQDTFIDKEWARGLRKLLSESACIRYIVDLNPFGQLFFNAMNTPCITVADNEVADDGECVAVLSRPPEGFKGLSSDKRRARVESTIRSALTQIVKKGRLEPISIDFARAARIPRSRLRETANGRWDLSGLSSGIDLPKRWNTVANLLEMRQGVTPGGCLDLFLMPEEKSQQLELEDTLVHEAIKSKNLCRWKVASERTVIFYPYLVTKDGAAPAFEIEMYQIDNGKLIDQIRQAGLKDALDFDVQIDAREKEIVRQAGVNRSSATDLLQHRIALGLVAYPRAAAYLVEHYERLEGRIFKKRNIRTFARRWYEFLWPRDPTIMLAKKRILAPTLVKPNELRFALDTSGYLSDHACLYIQPTRKTGHLWRTLCSKLTQVLGHESDDGDALKYCLAFLNSDYAQMRLLTGHLPTPKGFYAITEEFLKEIPVPPPQSPSATAIVDLVHRLVIATDPKKSTHLEGQLATFVNPLMSAARP